MKIFCKSLLVFIFLNALLLARASGVWAASLSLSPATATKTVGESFDVDIILDTEGEEVSGATAILNYDTTLLEVVGSTITAGTILTQVLENRVDPTTGEIRFDAGALGSTYNSRGTLATITFRAAAAGAAQVDFVFDENSTLDTSQVAAASGPTPLLTEVNNGTYTINSSGSTTPPPTLPATGAFENTIFLLFGGAGFAGIGGFLARKFLF